MAGMSNYLRNKIADWYHRGIAFTPPANVYVALCSAASVPSASVAGTELVGAGYARELLAHSVANMSATNGDTLVTNPSTGTTGTSSNNAEVDFGVSGAAWGTAVYWETYDALVAGNRLHYGTIVNSAGVPTPRLISSGDPVKFPISGLRFLWA